jgi:hypothetical protein
MKSKFEGSGRVNREDSEHLYFTSQRKSLELKQNFEGNISMPESTLQQREFNINNMELIFRLMVVAMVIAFLAPLA